LHFVGAFCERPQQFERMPAYKSGYNSLTVWATASRPYKAKHNKTVGAFCEHPQQFERMPAYKSGYNSFTRLGDCKSPLQSKTKQKNCRGVLRTPKTIWYIDGL